MRGNFPIGFKIWNTERKNHFSSTQSKIYNELGQYTGTKVLSATENSVYINKWISLYKVKEDFIGFLAGTNGNDFQQNGIVYIINNNLCARTSH